MFDGWTTINQFNKEDSVEGLYVNDTLLNFITDTLPLYTLDDNSSWRDMKLVFYYYDSSNTLKKISFRNGQEGYYYFYFKGAVLLKARLFKPGGLTNSKYYFSAEENRLTISDIMWRATQDPSKKGLYETLKLGKEFLQKFKTFF